jgi:hypothetical protein
MLLSQFIQLLNEKDQVRFFLPDEQAVPPHYHITEVGLVQKHYIDCGGTIRNESVISFQLYTANDTDHRLTPERINKIINIAKDKLQLPDAPIEVEYQGNTIGKYHLENHGDGFILTTTYTDCLASDRCGIDVQKPKLKLQDLPLASSCEPGSGCC